MYITDRLKQEILLALDSVLKEPLNQDYRTAQNQQWSVDPVSHADFGDFSTNVAMQLFSKQSEIDKKKYTSPRALATAIAERMNESTDARKRKFNKVEVAGPGFINFHLTSQVIWQEVVQVSELIHQNTESVKLAKSTVTASTVTTTSADSTQPQSVSTASASSLLNSPFNGKKVLVEFTDPNPFKELHIGHAYSNIVGESIAKLFEQAGATVLRVCYQGDVGMHVAKSVWGMKAFLSEGTRTLADFEEKSLSERIAFLGKAYAKGATAYEEDVRAQAEIKEINFYTYASAQQRLVKEENWIPQVDYEAFLTSTVQDKEEINRLYNKGRSWSLEYFDEMYSKLGMQFDDFFFESLVGEYGAQIVYAHLAKNVFKKSNGAIIFPGSDYGLHDRVFINSLGFPTYEAKELGLAPEKYRRHRYDHSVIITGNEIKEYFMVLLKAMSITHPELAAKTHHLSHGMVRLPEGKMSSRTGNVLTAQWLLEEAQTKMIQKIQESQPSWDRSKRVEAARKVSLGAIKYAFLKQSIGNDIAFSFDESLSFTGQSGPYLQYMYVRCASILEKYAVAEEKLVSNSANKFAKNTTDSTSTTFVKNRIKASLSKMTDISDSYTLVVARSLLQYPRVLRRSLHEYAPHHLAVYVFELAQVFSAFYDQVPILQEKDQTIKEQRLAIVFITQQVLQHGMTILGIEVMSEM